MSKKSPENWKKNPKRAKIVAKILKIGYLKKKWTYVEKYTEGYKRTIFDRFILIYESMIAKKKKRVWLTFDCKLGQSDPIMIKLKLDMSCHWMYILSLKAISQSMLKKSPENSDGRTDGQTDGHCHSIIRPFFKRAYKNYPTPYTKWHHMAKMVDFKYVSINKFQGPILLTWFNFNYSTLGLILPWRVTRDVLRTRPS